MPRFDLNGGRGTNGNPVYMELIRDKLGLVVRLGLMNVCMLGRTTKHRVHGEKKEFCGAKARNRNPLPLSPEPTELETVVLRCLAVRLDLKWPGNVQKLAGFELNHIGKRM